jgi:membrane protease YdiL (CAAX protease family)
MVGWTLLLLAGGVVVELAFRALAIRFGIREEPMLRAMLPQTTGERWAFAVLSVCAGFSEEMAYRGYVIPMLLPHLGVVGAVAASSLAFGLLHAYQGGIGILRTGIIGILMAVGYLMSGSLWPPVLAHLLFDVLAGIFLAEYFMVPEETLGVSAAVETSVEV